VGIAGWLGQDVTPNGNGGTVPASPVPDEDEDDDDDKAKCIKRGTQTTKRNCVHPKQPFLC